MTTATVTPMFVWNGFINATAGRAEIQLLDELGGHIGAAEALLPYCALVDAAQAYCDSLNLDYPGVFAYEVAEHFGRTLARSWHEPLAKHRAYLATIVASFFIQDADIDALHQLERELLLKLNEPELTVI